jgi:hypothetical protein
MGLGLTQHLAEIVPGIFLWDEGRPAGKADNHTICEPIVYKMWEPRRLTTLRAFTACYRDSFTLPFLPPYKCNYTYHIFVFKYLYVLSITSE